MSRKPDRFQMTEEFGVRLSALRKRAGLTQSELARLVGAGWAHSLVAKLESGHYGNPGLGLVADYLRACRASFADLADLLDAYTSKPRPIELRGQKAVARVSEVLPASIGDEVRRYDIKTTLARRAKGGLPLSPEERVKRVVNLAAAAGRRKRLDILVAHVVDEVGCRVASERRFVDWFARKAWGVLSSTRGARKHLRPKRMGSLLGEGIGAHVLPEPRLRLVRDRVEELFRAMELTGGLRPPSPTRPALTRPPKKFERDPLAAAQIAREANISVALGPVMKAVQTKERPAGEAVSLYLWLTKLAGKAYDTLPGSPEREQMLAEALKDRPDQDDARRFAELALADLDRQLGRK